MNKDQETALTAPFSHEDIEWRLAMTRKNNTGKAVAYLNSRAIQERFDKVLGKEGWQNKFYTSTGNGRELSTFICEIGIYYPDLKEWLWKSDGAGNTDIEPVKGGLSNAFKRTASMWGCGRYLYDLDEIDVQIEEFNGRKYIARSEKGRLNQVYDNFISRRCGGSAAASKPTSNPTEIPTSLPNGSFQVIKSEPRKSSCYLSMVDANGELVEAYIPEQIQPGAILCNVKLEQKSNPAIGNYNIISQYKIERAKAA